MKQLAEGGVMFVITGLPAVLSTKEMPSGGLLAFRYRVRARSALPRIT